jgi:hypothetical protein
MRAKVLSVIFVWVILLVLYIAGITWLASGVEEPTPTSVDAGGFILIVFSATGLTLGGKVITEWIWESDKKEVQS